MNQADFAAIAGATKQSQVRYEAGERSPDGNYLAAVATSGVDVSYVVTGAGAADRLAQQAADALHIADEFASIPIHDAFLAAGYAAQNDTEAVVGHLAFRRDWLDRQGIKPEKARLARVSGLSMFPTLHDQDLVLINTALRDIPVRRRGPDDTRRPPIYALNTEDGPRIKRVESPEKGWLRLLSDNNEYPVEDLTGDRLTRAEIIGKVEWWGHTVRD